MQLFGRRDGELMGVTRTGWASLQAADILLRMDSGLPARGLRLVEVEDECVLAALDRVRSMSIADLRELAQGEDPAVVAAVEAVIATRESQARESS